MKVSTFFRRLGIVFLVTAVLLAALTPAVPGLLFALVVAPRWFLCATSVTILLRVSYEPIQKLPFLDLAVFSPRPPPVFQHFS